MNLLPDIFGNESPNSFLILDDVEIQHFVLPKW